MPNDRSMTSARRCAAVLALVSSVCVATAASAEIIEDDWLIIRIADQPAGKAHVTTTREGNLITAVMDQSLSMARMGMPITQEMTLESVETIDGKPISFKQKQKMAAQVVEVEGQIEDGILTLTSRTMGKTRTRTVEWPAATKFGYQMELFVRENVTKKGAVFSFSTFSVELDKFVEVTYEVVDELDIEVLGQKVRVFKSKVKGLYPGVIPIEYRDADGLSWKVELGMMGLKMEMLRTNEETARDRTKRPANFDALLDLSVRPSRKISRPREVNSARYRLSLKDGGFEDIQLNGPGQKVTSGIEGGATVIEVTAVVPDASTILPHPIKEPKLKKFLSPSTFVQSDDAELIKVAQEVTGEVRSSYAAAKRLEMWVFRNITEKGFDRGFATAKEVLQDRAGDCTEHGVLLCALLRAAGIPSRVVAGVVYLDLPTGKPIFGYHMWTEAYVGEWVPLDATLAGRFVDAAHIRLSSSDLGGMSPVAGLVEIFQLFGQLEIDVLDYSVAGKRVASNAKQGRIEKRYRDLIYEFSFASPDEWEITKVATAGLDQPEICRCIHEGGEEQIVVLTRQVAPGMTLSDVLERLYGKADVDRSSKTSLGGVSAARVAYTKNDGTRREAVTTVRAGTVYVLRLEPPTTAGRAALDDVVESFRFE